MGPQDINGSEMKVGSRVNIRGTIKAISKDQPFRITVLIDEVDATEPPQLVIVKPKQLKADADLGNIG